VGSGPRVTREAPSSALSKPVILSSDNLQDPKGLEHTQRGVGDQSLLACRCFWLDLNSAAEKVVADQCVTLPRVAVSTTRGMLVGL
jgi:hypothetical protein